MDVRESGWHLIDYLSLAGSVAIVALVATLIARGRLKPRYALLWLSASGFLVLVSSWRGLIDRAGAWVGIDYKPALLFLASDVCLMLILLHLSVTVSTLSDQVRRLAQDIALLRGERE